MLPSTPLPARIFRVGRISRQNGLSARARWQSGELQGEREGESFSPRLPTTSPDGQKPLPVGGVHALCHGQRPSTVVDSVRVYDINESAESIIPTRDINVLQLPVTNQDRCFAPSKQIIAIVRIVRKLLDIENFSIWCNLRETLKLLLYLASHRLQSTVIKREEM